MLVKPLLARDPTGETLRLIDALGGTGQPASHNGVWVSHDGARSLLLATTRALGADTDGLEAAIGTLNATFAEVQQQPGLGDLRLVMTGPGVFAVSTRATIKTEALRLALTGASLIVALLLFVYRSPLALLLGDRPGARRRTGRHHGGQPGFWHRAWPHPRLRRHADRRSGRLRHLLFHSGPRAGA